jgi:hypothetical protein
LAAEIADGAVTWQCPARYLRDVALPALDTKTPGGQRPRLVGHAFLALDADAQSLQAAVQEFLVHYPKLTNYQEMSSPRGFLKDAKGVGRNPCWTP